MKVYFDAEGAIVGRLGSYAAKELLKGKEVVIINSEKAIISGDRTVIVGQIRNVRKMGEGSSSMKGPKISRSPDRLLKRMIRGMMPRKKARGREAYKRLRCYVGLGIGKVKQEDLKLIKKIEYKKPIKSSTIKEIAKLL